MPTPAPRTPICIARGNFADLQAGLADLQEGEICYAADQNVHYMKASGTLKKVDGAAFSGDYNDLTNKPTIPSVGDGRITLKQGGTTKGTFTVNQAGNTEIEFDAGGGGDSYVLPPATASELGGIKVGTGLSVAGDGTLSATGGGGGGIGEAPTDGKQYGRQNSGWTEIVSGGGGFSGDYNDLTNKPTIGDGTIVIKQGGVSKGSFTVNQEGDGEINIDASATGGIEEAPTDGKQYGRQDSGWTEIVPVEPGGAIDTVVATPDTGITADTVGGDVTLAGIDATEAVKGVVQFATSAQVSNGDALVAVQASQLKAAIDGLEPLPDGTTDGDLMQWDGSKWVVSNLLDGGTF